MLTTIHLVKPAICLRFTRTEWHCKTPERFAILQEIYDYAGHFDVDQLYSQMKEGEFRVQKLLLQHFRATVRLQSVRKHQFDNKNAQYEKSFRVAQHDHVIIADTGEVLEFCDPRIQQIKATLEEIFDIEVLHHSLNIYAKKRTK